MPSLNVVRDRRSAATPRRTWRPGLRARAAIGVALVTALMVGALALVSYGQISSDVLSEREEVAQRQAYANARVARARLRSAVPDPGAVLTSLGSTEGTPLLQVGGTWYSATVGPGRSDIPSGVFESVADGHAAYQRVRVGANLVVVVGTPIAAIDAAYFEFVPLADVETTLGAVRRSLGLGALVAAGFAGILAALVSRRILRPLHEVAVAAGEVRDGDLTVRLAPRSDPDLDPLIAAFNEMVGELHDRVERDARFASNVAHELRGPLASLSAAGEHARRHADDPAEVRASLDILRGTVRDFNGLVVDLLDISRMEAGVASLTLEPVEIRSLINAVIDERPVRVDVDPDVPDLVVLDKRRVGQCLANLLQNADRYAGGATAVVVCLEDDLLSISVLDAGPGVPEEERTYIFERFARGAAAEDVAGGTGLGLALVREHMRLHGGSVTVGAADDGGSIFRLELSIERQP